MTEISRVWGGTTPGDAGPYTLDHWGDIWDSLFNRNVANGGVLHGLNGELAVSGTISPVNVVAGFAMVNGTWYRNDASMTVAIPTPGAATRIDLIVLRKSWAAQTVRVTRVAGVEGGGAPALTQSDGVTWDIPLAQVSITTGGVITVTDTRAYAVYATAPIDISVVEGRLTLTSGTPVTTADVTAATNIFFTPYNGNRITLYNGANWDTFTFSELTLPLGTLTPSICYDVFAVLKGGTVSLEMLAWSSATARATALTTQDGVLVKTGDATRRYLGTFYTLTATTTEDSKSSRLLWNYYNRKARTMLATDTTNTWNYNSPTWRAANASTTVGVARVQLVIGWADDIVRAQYYGIIVSSGASQGAGTGVALDATNTNHADSYGGRTGSSTTSGFTSPASYRAFVAVGFHFLQAVEATDGNALVFTGDNGTTAMQSGLQAEVLG